MLKPSVTTVGKVVAAPGLVNWQIDQAVMAALTATRLDGEDDKTFIARIKREAQEQAFRAADFGTTIHGQIEKYYRGEVDIGYAFLPKFWSKGYALESAQGVMKFAKEVVGLRRLVAIVDPANTGSIRVLERLGMTFEKMAKLSADDNDLKLFAVNL